MCVNAKVQEGDEPAEAVDEIIATYESQMARLEELIVLINKTNATSLLEDFSISITDAIAKRDCIRSKLRSYKALHNAATIQQERYARNEVRYVRCISPKQIQQKIDELAKAYRELDTKIQTANWNTTIRMEVNSDITPMNEDNYYGR
jgi:predicted GTPase